MEALQDIIRGISSGLSGTDIFGLLKEFSLVFLPMLVAMDPIATLPLLVPFLSPIPPERRGKVINTALLTGLLVGLLFLALGRGIFAVLGIEIPDFLIAGGLILLVVALRELIGDESSSAPVELNELMAVVPIGTPLLVGPATISMLILLSSLYNIWLVLAAFLLNVAIAWLVFMQSGRIARFLGRGGLKAFSKVAYLLMAAIAVQLIRRGITDIWRAAG
ncbi:MAG: MarC family protein [SAR202 cluster bacterium]|nr:MarC family protein [SAR202 cluster bacterium]